MRKNRKNQEISRDAYDYLSNAASSRDQTSLILGPPFIC